MTETLAKLNELFVRDCTFVSHMDEPVSIKNFITGLNFEWKLSLGSYKLYNQFCIEILDLPNNVLGLPALNNWNVITINVDPTGFTGGLKEVKRDLLLNIHKFIDTEKIFNNRIIIFTIKFTLNITPFL